MLLCIFSYTWSEIGELTLWREMRVQPIRALVYFELSKSLVKETKNLLASLWLVYTLQCTTAFWLCFYWQTSETYEKNILAILQYCMIFWHHTWLSCHYLSIPEEKKSNHWLISEKSWIEYKFSVANYIHIRVNY